MKKNVLLLMALCLNVLAMQAQEKQVFTIDGYVDENITDSCYNIYLADEYFKIDEGSKPVATVPVVNKQFTYSIPLDKMTAGRVRCISPGGELRSTWIDLFFVPGETVKLTVHKGKYDIDRPYSYRMKINRAVEAIRKKTNWQSPHLPRVKGEVWKNVAYDKDESPEVWVVKDVIFNDEETVLRILYANHTYNMNIGKNSYLQDEDGNTYKLKRALMGLVEEDNSTDIRIFGGYYAFEPMPKGTKSFSFHSSYSPFYIFEAADSAASFSLWSIVTYQARLSREFFTQTPLNSTVFTCGRTMSAKCSISSRLHASSPAKGTVSRSTNPCSS